MIVAVGTKNRAKIEGVSRALGKAWADAEIISVESDSGVSAMPMTDEEGILGAINRAKGALKSVAGAVYGIGLEGTANENKYGVFLGGWVAIVDNTGKAGIGSSGKVLLPEWIAKRLKAGEELGPITQNMMGDSENKIRHSLGTCGLLTNGLYTRVDEFEEATKCALAKFLAGDFYEKEAK